MSSLNLALKIDLARLQKNFFFMPLHIEDLTSLYEYAYHKFYVQDWIDILVEQFSNPKRNKKIGNTSMS